MIGVNLSDAALATSLLYSDYQLPSTILFLQVQAKLPFTT